MDNITHALTGLLTGELVERSVAPERDRFRRKLLLVTGVAASNFPDLDLVLTPLLPRPLGYLLMHRGHTHTFLYCLPQALILTLAIWFFWPAARARLKADRRTRWAFALTMFTGFVLHVGMDFMNSYGVHPFYPFDPSWYYGDAVFIVEPILWVTLGAAVVTTFERRWLRRLWIGILIGAPLVASAFDVIPLASWVALTIVAYLLVLLQNRVPARGRAALFLSVALSVIYVGAQRWLSGEAKAAARRHLAATSPALEPLDVVANPLPADPLCWHYQAISVDQTSDTYEAQSGVLSLWPEIVQASHCSAHVVTDRGPEADTSAFRMLSRQLAKIGDFRALAQRDCRFRAWLRFARVPFVGPEEAVDIRFSTASTAHNFTTLPLGVTSECPSGVPGWRPPREDMLRKDDRPR